MTMRRLFTRAACVGLLLAATATASSAANLLTNPGFESGDLTGWLVFGVSGTSNVFVQSPDNGPSAPGQFNAFMDNRAEAVGLTLKQSTPAGSVVPGTVFWSFDLKLGQAANGGVFFAQVFAERAGGGVIGGTPLLGNFTPGAWTRYSGQFEAPAGTDFLTIQFMANTGAVIGSVSSMHVDNVDLNQGNVVPAEPATWGRLKTLYR